MEGWKNPSRNAFNGTKIFQFIRRTQKNTQKVSKLRDGKCKKGCSHILKRDTQIVFYEKLHKNNEASLRLESSKTKKRK